jgi:hypothetical protein
MERLIIVVDGGIFTVERESKKSFLNDLDAEYERVFAELNAFVPMPNAQIGEIHRSFAYKKILSFDEYHRLKNGIPTQNFLFVYTLDEFLTRYDFDAEESIEIDREDPCWVYPNVSHFIPNYLQQKA